MICTLLKDFTISIVPFRVYPLYTSQRWNVPSADRQIILSYILTNSCVHIIRYGYARHQWAPAVNIHLKIFYQPANGLFPVGDVTYSVDRSLGF
jgi:hypothetical protein